MRISNFIFDSTALIRRTVWHPAEANSISSLSSKSQNDRFSKSTKN